jgi:hypothetical protein
MKGSRKRFLMGNFLIQDQWENQEKDGRMSLGGTVVSRPCTGGKRIVDIVLWRGAEPELWLRPGCEGLLALTITRCTKWMEFIVSK